MNNIDLPFKRGSDFGYLRKVLLREAEPGPVPFIELAVDTEIMSEITGVKFPSDGLVKIISGQNSQLPEVIELGLKYLELSLEFSKAIGYDYVTVTPIVPIPRTPMNLKENPKQDGKMRAWQNEHNGLIATRDDFENFPWRSVDSVNTAPIDIVVPKMPSGMKVMVLIFGIFEDLKLLMGFENMAIKSIEEPHLLDDILERLTELEERATDMCASHPDVGAIFYAEDMGFNNGTMLSPKWMREHIIPRIKRIAEACHKHGKPFLLHSCGRIDALMEDLINEVKIDGRHSFQDNVERVEDVYRKYAERISILGGVDVDLLSRGTVEEVRKRTREILDICAPTGGFCMGSGNSVTNFCKTENYLAMLDETMKWNREHFG